MAGPNGARGSVMPQPHGRCRGRGPRQGADLGPGADREAARQGRHHAAGRHVRPPIEVIPTGSIALDMALGVGGLPRGRIVEIFGPGSRQDDRRPARGGQRAEGRRHRRVHRRRARARPRVRQGARASTSTTSSSPSPTPASRRSRSPTCSSAPAPWTSSSSTRSPLWCRVPRSRARWATPTSASRPGSCRRRCASSPVPQHGRARP